MSFTWNLTKLIRFKLHNTLTRRCGMRGRGLRNLREELEVLSLIHWLRDQGQSATEWLDAIAADGLMSNSSLATALPVLHDFLEREIRLVRAFAKRGDIGRVFRERAAQSFVHQTRNALIQLRRAAADALVQSGIQIDRDSFGGGHGRSLRWS